MTLAGRRTQALPLVVAVAAATLLRSVTGRPAPAFSNSAALIFAAALTFAAVAAGWRPSRPRPLHIAAGIGCGAGLVLMSRMRLPNVLPVAALALLPMVPWMLVVSCVATAEEIAIRGALFDAVTQRSGVGAAIGVTAVLFALIHIPLYGAPALPIDLGVGIMLGGLRAATSVSASTAAHLTADFGGGLLI